MEKQTPDFVTEGDGFADITLASAATIAGAKVSSMRMREPTAGDLESFHDSKGTEAAREIRIFANLCEVTPDEVRALSVRNYGRLQAAFSHFTS